MRRNTAAAAYTAAAALFSFPEINTGLSAGNTEKGECPMKKLLALILAIVTLISLTACGKPAETEGPPR